MVIFQLEYLFYKKRNILFAFARHRFMLLCKQSLVRVQSADGIKRIEISPKSNIKELYEHVQKALKVNGFGLFKERNFTNELYAKSTQQLGTLLKHGDMLYLKQLAGTSSRRTSATAIDPLGHISATITNNDFKPSAGVVEDEVDQLLAKEHGLIKRERDSKFNNMSENSNTNCFGDSDSEDYAPPKLKSGQQKKSTAGRRKIQHTWTDEEIHSLIACIEQHLGLWNFSALDYKLSKRDEWQSVVDELEIDGVDVKEAKVKWHALRSTYMSHMGRIRKRKSRKGKNATCTVKWQFFQQMMFLENVNHPHSTSATSKPQMESGIEEVSLPPPSRASEFEVDNKHKRLRSRTPTPLPLPSQSPSAESFNSLGNSILNSAVSALPSSDTNSTFCDYLLAELRTLSEPEARALRYKISRLTMDFMEDSQE